MMAFSAGDTASNNSANDLASATLVQLKVGSSLDRLPNDILLEIWTHLDCPRNLSRSSKRFQLIGQDTFFYAKWLLHRYMPCLVMYEAIARPKMFNERLFQLLLNSGAPLSRHLVQLLLVLHLDSALTNQGRTSWGRKVKFSMVMIVAREAQKLYGAEISFDAHDLDDYRFERYLEAFPSDNDQNLQEHFRRFIMKGRHVSLPLIFARRSKDYDSMAVKNARRPGAERVLVVMPSLAPVLQSNGWRFTVEGSLYLCRRVFARGHKEVPAEHIVDHLLVLLDAGMPPIPRVVASEVLMGLRGSLPKANHSSHWHSHGQVSQPTGQVSTEAPESPPLALTSYRALMMLEKIGSLNFSVTDVVRDMVKLLDGGKIDITMAPLLEKLSIDFPTVDMDSLHVQLAFLKAELASTTDLTAIACMIGKRKVTKHAVMKVCLRNLCRSTTALQYAARFVEDFDVELFVAELVEYILDQPYRGRMLSALDDLMASSVPRSSLPGLSVDFRNMLAKAVEQKAFFSSMLPVQQWSDESHAWYRKPVSRSVRSLLAYRWVPTQGSFVHDSDIGPDNQTASVYSVNISDPHSDQLTGPRALRGVTHFMSSDKGQRPSTLGISAPPSSGDPIHLIRLQDIIEAENEAAQPNCDTEEYNSDYDDDGDIDVDQYAPHQLEKERYMNLLGPTAADDEDIATCIVDLLGPDCKAADVVLSHCFANYNEQLQQKLLERGARPTLDHFAIALKTSNWNLPSAKLNKYFDEGAPFKYNFEAPDNVSHPNFREWNFTTLTPEERDVRHAFRAEVTELRVSTIVVDIDETGTIHLRSEPEGPRTLPVLEIRTASVASGNDFDEMREGEGSETSKQEDLASSNSAALKGKAEQDSREASDGMLGYFFNNSEREDLARRISSSTLWKQHLKHLLAKEQKRRAVVSANLPQSDRYTHEHTCSSIKRLVEHLENRLARLAKE